MSVEGFEVDYAFGFFPQFVCQIFGASCRGLVFADSYMVWMMAVLKL